MSYITKLIITDVYCSDWHWVYVNNFLLHEEGEGCTLTCKNLMNIIQDALETTYKKEGLYKIEFHEVEIFDDYVEKCGRFLPDCIHDIPIEAFYKKGR